jgi:hypothetical protein
MTLAASKIKRHPLGFLHVTLMDTADTSIRLHIWKPGERLVQEPAWLIHTHTFELTSMVLSGKLKNRVYSWTDDPIAGERRLYQTTYDDNSSSLIATDRVGKIQHESTSEISQGGQYTVPYGYFHQTEVVENQFTATIALTKKYLGNPLVVGSIGGATSHSYIRSELDGGARHQIIDEVTRSINY